MAVTEPALEASVVDRYRELTRRARALNPGRRIAGPTLVVLVGAVTTSFGLLLVVLGYLGASRTIYVFEQIPYLISGGIFGGCLVVAGSLTYFAHWLTRVHADGRRSAEALERMEQLLAALVEQGRAAERGAGRSAGGRSPR